LNAEHANNCAEGRGLLLVTNCKSARFRNLRVVRV
jgi:hypothetical protein